MTKRMLAACIGFFTVCCFFAYLYYFSIDDSLSPIVPQESESPAPAPSPSSPVEYTTEPPAAPSEPSHIQLEQPSAGSQPYCYIKEFNGRVSIYATPAAPIPDIITDIPLSILPAVDQEAVRRGFFLYSEAELSKLLEDLGS